ncbi:heavy metal-associated domain-containing protein [Roseivirga sp. UBA838]|uniref:heavy-metal-associated domain-containing protein n=1 Tax=Roseivirga sp. UBA838 TaxID=1947393 RepID=UPI002579EE18|nr:heavy metal-associated domain-containing protein [Roseivirga sp. UBA838]|tara:strand:- start:13289 stop:13780 length:492 start_codon:yes stop_codon:yes gene_type:complete
MKKLGIIALLTIFSLSSAMAQLIKVDQEVFGMDCAPCAYGLERGLKKMDGLESVKVSLNDGKAYLKLASDNDLTLQKIQEEVKSNGFSARNAEVTLIGQLVKKESEWQINVNGETFIVSPETPSEIVKSLNTGEIKATVFVKDKKANHLNGTWDIRIIEVLKS